MTPLPAAMVADSAPATIEVNSARAAAANILAWSGIAATVLAAVIIGALHVIPPTSSISPVTRTISEYGLTTLAWAFNLGVIALAVGSLAVFAALTMLRRASPLALLFGALWIAGLLTLVLFPKHNWAVGPSSSGQVHRMASLVAFLALPIAVLVITAGRRQATTVLAFCLGIASLLWFSPIPIAILTSRTAWWQAIPLGLVERGMALTELIAVIVLGIYAAQARAALSSAGGPPPLR